MRLPRPYIPYSVRVSVASRQVIEASLTWATDASLDALPDSKKLRALLLILFHGERVHLDHDPPLMNRHHVFRDGKHVDYIPRANDPDYLLYRTVADHDIKTRVRGDGAQYSDHALARKNKRIKRNRDPKRRVAKIAQPKNFKWPKRPFRNSRSSK